jgi:hypothetical protein
LLQHLLLAQSGWSWNFSLMKQNRLQTCFDCPGLEHTLTAVGSIQRSDGIYFDHQLRLGEPANLDGCTCRHRVTVEFHANIYVFEIFVDVSDVGVGANKIRKTGAGSLQNQSQVFEDFSQLRPHISDTDDLPVYVTRKLSRDEHQLAWLYDNGMRV